MEMKSLKITKKNWMLLMRLKLDYGYESLDQIINKLLKIVPASELKEAKKK